MSVYFNSIQPQTITGTADDDDFFAFDASQPTRTYFLNGQLDADTILGGEGHDIIYTTPGPDRLNGGGGYDTLNFGQSFLLNPLASSTSPFESGQSHRVVAATVNLAAGTYSLAFGRSFDTFDAGDVTLLPTSSGRLTGFEEIFYFGSPNVFLTLIGSLGGQSRSGAVQNVETFSLAYGNVTVDGGVGYDILTYDTRLARPNSTAGAFDWVDVTRGVIVDAAAGLIDVGGGSFTQFENIERIDGTFMADTFNPSDGNDTFLGLFGNDLLHGGSGDDWLDAGESADTLYGGVGNDYVVGGPGQDLLTGGVGNDTITGGADADTLSGGGGNDRFVVRLDAEAPDTIVDFTFGEDSISIDANAAGARMKQSTTNQINIGGVTAILDSVGSDLTVSNLTGQVILNLTGALRGLATTITTELSEKAKLLTGSDIVDRLFGGNGPDTIQGYGNSDILGGSGGNDFIFGGLGKDDIEGGTGNDLLSGGEDGDKLYAGNGDDTLTGDAGNDWVFGGAGDDLLDGGSGSDRMGGGAGRDLFVVTDNGRANFDQIDDFSIRHDTIDLSAFAPLGLELDRSDLSIRTVDSLGEVYIVSIDSALSGRPVEAFSVQMAAGQGRAFLRDAKFVFGNDNTGSPRNDNLTGTRSFDNMFGLAGADILRGLAGRDLMSGEKGNDDLYGGTGNDALTGGVGNDKLDGGAGDDILDGGAGSDFVIGGAGNDRLSGGEGNDRLVGGDGDDELIAGAGDVTMTGGKGADTFVFSQSAMDNVLAVITDFDPDEDMLRFDQGLSLSNLNLEVRNDKISLGTGGIFGDVESPFVQLGAWPNILDGL